MVDTRLRGYTLIELLAVLAILGVLAALVMPLAEVGAERAREHELRRALWEIRDALDAYRDARVSGAIGPVAGADPKGPPYPPDLKTLTQLASDMRPEHHGESLRFLRQVPRDPFADPALPVEAGWAPRGYLSEASAPVPGAEVYDVHSRATGLALDGTPLAQW